MATHTWSLELLLILALTRVLHGLESLTAIIKGVHGSTAHALNNLPTSLHLLVLELTLILLLEVLHVLHSSAEISGLSLLLKLLLLEELLHERLLLRVLTLIIILIALHLFN